MKQKNIITISVLAAAIIVILGVLSSANLSKNDMVEDEGADYIKSMMVAEMENEIEHISEELESGEPELSNKELTEIALNDMDDIDQSTIVDKRNPKIERKKFNEDPRFAVKGDENITLVGKRIAVVIFESTMTIH